jgi:hypothetical protein
MQFQELQGEVRRMGDVARGWLPSARHCGCGSGRSHPHVDARLADVITAMLPNFVLLVLCVSFEMEVAVPLKWKLWCHENREAICLANHIWISRRGKSLSAR